MNEWMNEWRDGWPNASFRHDEWQDDDIYTRLQQHTKQVKAGIQKVFKISSGTGVTIMNEWTNERMNGWMNGWMDKWMNGQMLHLDMSDRMTTFTVPSRCGPRGRTNRKRSCLLFSSLDCPLVHLKSPGTFLGLEDGVCNAIRKWNVFS